MRQLEHGGEGGPQIVDVGDRSSAVRMRKTSCSQPASLILSVGVEGGEQPDRPFEALVDLAGSGLDV